MITLQAIVLNKQDRNKIFINPKYHTKGKELKMSDSAKAITS